MQKVSSITRLVRWFCKQLNFDELLVAANILLEIINGKRDDIELRTNIHENIRIIVSMLLIRLHLSPHLS